jgi:hypothetical protein
MTTWLGAVAQGTGRPPIIYTNAASSSFIGSGFGSTTLWVANWATTCPTMPAGWSTWKFWQYSDMGMVSGISGAVDVDEFDGTLADLTSFAGGGSTDAGRIDGGTGADGAGTGGDGGVDAGSTGGGGSPGDAGATPMPDAGSAMGGGLTDASPTTQPCVP